MKSLCAVVAVFVAIVAGVFGDAPTCTKLSVCSCKTDSGNIDLTHLTKMLKVNDTQGAHEFQYSPCTDNGKCNNATVCMDGVSAIGKSSEETFITKNGKIAIKYPGDDNKTSVVILNCDQSKEGDLTFVNDSSDVFTFQLNSKYACAGGPSTSKTTVATSTTTKNPAKTTQTTPKTTNTSPKSPTTSAKSPTTSPKSPTTSPKSPTTSAKSPKTSPKSTETTPEGSKTTKTTPKGGNTTDTTPQSTTQGKAASNSSIGLAALTLFVLVCRQMFQ